MAERPSVQSFKDYAELVWRQVLVQQAWEASPEGQAAKASRDGEYKARVERARMSIATRPLRIFVHEFNNFDNCVSLDLPLNTNSGKGRLTWPSTHHPGIEVIVIDAETGELIWATSDSSVDGNGSFPIFGLCFVAIYCDSADTVDSAIFNKMSEGEITAFWEAFDGTTSIRFRVFRVSEKTTSRFWQELEDEETEE